MAEGQQGRPGRYGSRPVGIIFDSCIWVALASNDLDSQTVIDVAGKGGVYTSVISLRELTFGVEACTDPAERAMRAASLRQIEQRPTLQVTRHTAAAFGVLGSRSQTKRPVASATL